MTQKDYKILAVAGRAGGMLKMRNTVILVSVSFLILAVACVAWAGAANRDDSTCVATLSHECVVNFNGGGMEEDEFAIDYRGGKLHVKRIIP